MSKRNDIFTKAYMPKRSSSRFDLSFSKKGAIDMGYAYPLYLQEVLPGDRFKGQTTHVLKMDALEAPIFDHIVAKWQYWFVPNELVWNGWDQFLEDNKRNPRTIPYLCLNTVYYKFDTDEVLSPFFSRNSIWSILGYPYIDPNVDMKADDKINILPYMAHIKVFLEYKINENLSSTDSSIGNYLEYLNDLYDSTLFDGDGDLGEELINFMIKLNDFCFTSTIGGPLRQAWSADYFTTALPTPQRGTDVLLPLVGNAPLVLEDDNYINLGYPQSVGPDSQEPTRGEIDLGAHWDPSQGVGEGFWHDSSGMPLVENIAPINDISGVSADLSQASSTTLDTLRNASAVQRWFEAFAIGGSRVFEIIRTFFNEIPDDLRLKRPQWLGTGYSNFIISEVLQQSQTTDSASLGEYAGHGYAASNGNFFHGKFKQHGFIIGFLSVMPEANYQQGLNRMFSRLDRMDYYWPTFEHLGEQPVMLKELFFNQDSNSMNDSTFGYQSRYADYKFRNNEIFGDLADDGYNYWHLGRIFDNAPALNNNFIYGQSSDFNRIFPVVDGTHPHIFVYCVHNVQAIRKMSKYVIPSLT